MKITNILDKLGVGTLILAIPIADLTNVLTVILMVLSIALTAVNLIIKVVNAIKDKHIDDDECKDITDTFNELTDKIKDLNNKE